MEHFKGKRRFNAFFVCLFFYATDLLHTKGYVIFSIQIIFRGVINHITWKVINE